jgi:hypothetical protein
MATVAVLAGCSSSGIGAVADDDGFSTCVEDAGASLDGSEDWDQKAQLAFWAKPGTVDCALDELDTDQRRDALGGAFPEPDGGEVSPERLAEWDVVGDWAARTAETMSLEGVVEQGAALLGSLWVADADEPYAANGMAGAIVASAMRAKGELDGYDRYLDEHPDEQDSADLRVAYVGVVGGATPTPRETQTYDRLTDQLVEAVRSD